MECEWQHITPLGARLGPVTGVHWSASSTPTSTWKDKASDIFFFQLSSVIQSCPALCNPKDSSTPGFPVHHQLPELAQTHVYRVSDAIQPSHLVKQVQAHYKLDLLIKDKFYSLDASFSLDLLLFLSKQARKVSFSSLGVLLSLSKVALLVLSHFSLFWLQPSLPAEETCW